MADIGLDYAGSSPGAAAVKAAGFNFVMRYLSRYTAKTIKKPEYDDMTGNGVGVGLVFEDYANQALQGFAQGAADAQVALDQANALGWPESRPLYFAVDFDINDAQKPVAGEYMKGVHSVIGVGRAGAYGGYWWIKYCVDNGLATFFWQAVAWSGGQVHPSANLFQRLGGTTVNGTSCDINDALKADYGQNNYKGDPDMANAQQIDDTIALINQVGWAHDATPAIFDNLRQYLGNNYIDGIIQIMKNADVDPNSAKGMLHTTQAQLTDISTQLAAAQNQDNVDKAALADAFKKIDDLQKQLATPGTPTTPTDPTTPVVTVGGNQSFWDWVKSLFSKKP